MIQLGAVLRLAQVEDAGVIPAEPEGEANVAVGRVRELKRSRNAVAGPAVSCILGGQRQPGHKQVEHTRCAREPASPLAARRDLFFFWRLQRPSGLDA